MQAQRIGDVAKSAGVGIETIRVYERKGLIAEPPRTRSGYRQYPASVVARIRFIQRAQELGFSLAEIAELISLRIEPGTDCGDVRRTAEAKIAEVEKKIRDPDSMKKVLGELTVACAGEGPTSECPILASLDEGESLKG